MRLYSGITPSAGYALSSGLGALRMDAVNSPCEVFSYSSNTEDRKPMKCIRTAKKWLHMTWTLFAAWHTRLPAKPDLPAYQGLRRGSCVTNHNAAVVFALLGSLLHVASRTGDVKAWQRFSRACWPPPTLVGCGGCKHGGGNLSHFTRVVRWTVSDLIFQNPLNCPSAFSLSSLPGWRRPPWRDFTLGQSRRNTS